jgi:hypothetical protein
MGKSSGRLEQAIIDLIESYAALESSAEEKHGDDEDSYAHAMIESIETSLESAIDEGDISTGQFAAMLANLSEALEQLDPSAFEGEDDEEEDDDDVSPSDVDDLDEDLELDYEEEDEDED